MNRKHSSAKGRGIQKEKRKLQLELVDVSKDGQRAPESVESTSGTVEVRQKVVARGVQHGSDSDINDEDVEMEQQQQGGDRVPGTCSIPFQSDNGEKHEQQVQGSAKVPQVFDYENCLFVTK